MTGAAGAGCRCWSGRLVSRSLSLAAALSARASVLSISPTAAACTRDRCLRATVRPAFMRARPLILTGGVAGNLVSRFVAFSYDETGIHFVGKCSRPRLPPSGILGARLSYRQDPFMSLGARVFVFFVYFLLGLSFLAVPAAAGVGVRARAGDDVRDVRQSSVPVLSDARTRRAGGLLSAVVRVRRHVLALYRVRTDPFSRRARSPRRGGHAHRVRGWPPTRTARCGTSSRRRWKRTRANRPDAAARGAPASASR